jgi:hypothetical protein
MAYATRVDAQNRIPRESSETHRPNDECESAHVTSNAGVF